MNKGVNVFFDGYTCNVELSQVSRKNQCGLCGETDSELYGQSEFRTRDFTDEFNGQEDEDVDYPERDEFRTRDFSNTDKLNEFYGQDEDTEYPERKQFRSRDFSNTKKFNEFYGQDEDTEYPEDREFNDDYTCSNKRQWWGSDRKFNDQTCQKTRRQWGYDKPEWTFDESETEYKPWESKYNQYDSEFQPLESEHKQYETEYKPFETEFDNEFKPFERKSWEKSEWTNERSEEFETEFDQLSSGKLVVLKHKLIDNEDKICVSLQRIPQCQVNTQPENKVQKRVSFHCIDRNDRRVSLFEDRIQSGERIPEIERLTPSFTRLVVVPLKCTKSFY
jgi:hypothetical protein